MKLYVTLTSPYARIVRVLIIEKGLEDRVEIEPVATRTQDTPLLVINPSGRVPTLVNDDGVMFEESALICAYLDSLDGTPVLTPAAGWGERATVGGGAGVQRRGVGGGRRRAQARPQGDCTHPPSRAHASLPRPRHHCPKLINYFINNLFNHILKQR